MKIKLLHQTALMFNSCIMNDLLVHLLVHLLNSYTGICTSSAPNPKFPKIKVCKNVWAVCCQQHEATRLEKKQKKFFYTDWRCCIPALVALIYCLLIMVSESLTEYSHFRGYLDYSVTGITNNNPSLHASMRLSRMHLSVFCPALCHNVRKTKVTFCKRSAFSCTHFNDAIKKKIITLHFNPVWFGEADCCFWQ